MSNVHLGNLQLAIMRVLWSDGEGTVTSVHRALEPTHGLAPTTIATMLKKMEAKGVVAHHTEGRRFIYRPTVSEPEVTHSMVAELAQRLFGGDVTALAAHLIDEHEVDAGELDDLRKKIEAAQRAEESKR